MEPEDIFDNDQLARYYAVQAAGPVNDHTINAGDNIVGVAKWIIDGAEPANFNHAHVKFTS